MRYRRVGSSGLMVSEISLGNWITHGVQIDDAEAQACVRAAVDAGITSFDTADVYGETKAEAILARALKGIRREDLVVSSKVYWPTGPGPNDRGLSRKHVTESINASLRRLNTEYVDIYYAHRYDETTPLEETMTAFADLIRQGKALYMGLSEWRADQIRAAHDLARVLRIPLVSDEVQHSMLWRVSEAEVIPACTELGIGVFAWSPLAQGTLTGKYLPGLAPPAKSRGAMQAGSFRIHRFLTPQILERIQQLRLLSAEAGLTLPQLAIAWVLHNAAVSSVIIGATCAAQVTANSQAAGLALEPDLIKAADEILSPVAERDGALIAATTSPRGGGR